jgi:hypothetical protein
MKEKAAGAVDDGPAASSGRFAVRRSSSAGSLASFRAPALSPPARFQVGCRTAARRARAAREPRARAQGVARVRLPAPYAARASPRSPCIPPRRQGRAAAAGARGHESRPITAGRLAQDVPSDPDEPRHSRACTLVAKAVCAQPRLCKRLRSQIARPRREPPVTPPVDLQCVALVEDAESGSVGPCGPNELGIGGVSRTTHTLV